MNRAERRRLAARAKAKARRHLRVSLGEWRPDVYDDPKWVGIKAATPHPCSCYMCRNRRSDDGPTFPERLRDGAEVPPEVSRCEECGAILETEEACPCASCRMRCDACRLAAEAHRAILYDELAIMTKADMETLVARMDRRSPPPVG